MKIDEFADYHGKALASDDMRYCQVLSALRHAGMDRENSARLWTLGRPGACAVQCHGQEIVLGNVTPEDIRQLADSLGDHEFPGVVGPDDTARWFADAVKPDGIEFTTTESQTLHVIDHEPVSPNTVGAPRLASSDDGDLFHDWLNAFILEAFPHGKAVPRDAAHERVKNKQVFLWCVDGRAVAMSCPGQVLQSGVGIAPVYTKPSQRCRGYAGAVTAHVVNQIIDRGYKHAFLYTDDDNPASNRCYEKIGFRPYCKSRHYFK